MEMLVEWDELITVVPELYLEEEYAARDAQKPQVVYKGFGNTIRCGFFLHRPLSPNKYT